MLQAIIYCRVSSAKQVREGHGLDTQEKRCRDYAKNKGYKVIKNFREEGVSGKYLIRPEMENLILYLSENATKEKPIVVIFDDLKRFGRETENHFTLKFRIEKQNGRIESPGFRFEGTPDNKFIETILVAHGTLEREQNAIQVKNKMKARAESGYWVSKPPTGYKIQIIEGVGKLLVIDKNYGPIIKQALENFSNQIILTQIDFCDYLNKHGVKISTEGARGILKSPVYAGYLGGSGYTVTLRPAKHQGLINWSTYEKIQGLIKGKAKTIYHSNNATDFPLRNFIQCATCQNLMCSNWVTGRSKKYPYYVCKDKHCDEYNKNILREEVESRFEKILQSITPKGNVLDLAEAILKDVWKNNDIDNSETEKAFKKKLNAIKLESGNIIDRISKTEKQSVISVYEDKLEEIEVERINLTNQIKSLNNDRPNFQTSLKLVLEFIQNVGNIWSKGNLELKRLVLKLVFSNFLVYSKNDGFQTATLSGIYQLFSVFVTTKISMVDLSSIKSKSIFKQIDEMYVSLQEQNLLHF